MQNNTHILGINERKPFLYNLNPILKVIATIIVIVLIFLPTGFIPQLCILIGIIILLFLTKMPLSKNKALLKTFLFIFIISFLISWLTNKTPLLKVDLQNTFRYWGFSTNKLYDLGWINRKFVNDNFHYWYAGQIWGGNVSTILTDVEPVSGHYLITKIGGIKHYLSYSYSWYSLSSFVLIKSLSINIKIFMLLSILSLEVNTTSTFGLSYGIESLLKPLKYIKFPTNQTALIIAISLKYVPNLFKEANRVIDAQASRGLDFRNGNLFIKTKAIINLIVPVFSLSFNHADSLADNMEIRNYNPNVKRSRYLKYSIFYYDWIFVGVLLAVMILFSVMVGLKVIIGPTFLFDIYLI